MKEFWQKFGKSLLLPISTIAVAGIFKFNFLILFIKPIHIYTFVALPFRTSHYMVVNLLFL